MKVIKPDAYQMIYSGVIEGDNVTSYKKYVKEIRNMYTDSSNLKDDEVVYTVYSLVPQVNQDLVGELTWGLTVMEPLVMGDEYNMTRGHFHANRDCAEIYFGVSGKGLLMLMDESGNTWAQEVYQGSIHHIPGNLAHRLINVGDEVFKVGACWPTAAGHDYEAIEAKEFGYKVLKDTNGYKTLKR